MTTKPLTLPARRPAPPPSDPAVPFPASAELGDQLRHLSEAQAVIDRRKAEELARLRAVQDRD